ncbi:D-alanyl-D-alanine carboxypeptidase [Rubellimicrobium rubrum]|uniref:D-alanyl-D-alanine carboxypeptidase n=1 Tax=Rubellimicrobium rubrum TaxID=2585369 RepID=A0A5C4MY26_9RHOB|nr:serine hydrolase [Rubellimicrobium rubrum]TNC49341.1 D-alanyl-D-alanine carboxypeptidase [Rubellimicrobium rubrum]
MGSRFGRSAWLAFIILAHVLGAAAAKAAPFAAFVMDARTGQIFYEENAETPLHPASLTKMMTLYLAFQAIQQGEITLDTEVRIPADAADEPPSRLGLREGQTIRMRYLLRAAAVKSANDAAMAIGYALGGSREGFAARMNAMAQAMGMNQTHFMNANGLTQDGHYSTARDMSILGRHLVYDFPQYYNLFSRRSADAGMAQVNNTNRRFLDAYEGADGIKTGFTNAAGYNLTASAQRGDVRIIATVFGGTSTADRNARVSRLLDLGFAHAPAGAQVVMVDPPVITASDVTAVAANTNAAPTMPAPVEGARVSGPIETSLRPQPRPGSTVVAFASAVKEEEIEGALAEALAMPQPVSDLPAEIIMTAAAIRPEAAPLLEPEPEVVTRLSTSGGSLWGINLGSFPSRDSAERALIRVALAESTTLDGGLRRVIQRSGGFDANVIGLTRDEADLACRRLQARGTTCFMVGTEE